MATTTTEPAHTAASILALAASTPAFDDPDQWAAAWVLPITEFGLSINTTASVTPTSEWNFTTAVAVWVPVAQVTSSAQPGGVRLDALAHYLSRPASELFDRDGWFGNDHPVLIARSDGTYTVRDGNHRVIAAMLNGEPVILAYVFT